jgi:hypothetical protein
VKQAALRGDFETDENRPTAHALNLREIADRGDGEGGDTERLLGLLLADGLRRCKRGDANQLAGGVGGGAAEKPHDDADGIEGFSGREVMRDHAIGSD